MDWLNTNANGLTAVATIVTALIAAIAIAATSRDSRARSQPMVTPEFREAEHSDSTIDLVITNLGPTPARDLRVSFEPALVLPADSEDLLTPFLIQRYSSEIPTLNPGQSLSNVWWSGEATGPSGELQNGEPTPDKVTVLLSYLGIGSRRIKEKLTLDVKLITMTTSATSSTSTKARMASIEASLRRISEAVEMSYRR